MQMRFFILLLTWTCSDGGTLLDEWSPAWRESNQGWSRYRLVDWVAAWIETGMDPR